MNGDDRVAGDKGIEEVTAFFGGNSGQLARSRRVDAEGFLQDGIQIFETCKSIELQVVETIEILADFLSEKFEIFGVLEEEVGGSSERG